MRKNVLFIAKFDNVLKGMNALLAKSFNMQVCPPEPTMVSKILAVTEIDVILLYVSGLSNTLLASLCEKLSQVSLHIPIIVFGTEEECRYFESYCPIAISKYMYRPLAVNDIVEEINKLERVDPKAPPKPQAKPESGKQMSLADLAEALDTDERRCILLVDDDGRILRAMKMLLEKTYRVNLANSGTSALESIERERPDAILLDYEMPIINGKQTLELIRQNPNNQDLPVFFLTGVADVERIKEVIHLKPQGYILKSSEQSVILEALEKLFSGQSQ